MTVVPDPVVPRAMNCAVWLICDRDCKPGVIVTETIGSVETALAVTVRVALAVMVPVNPFMVAVIVVVPAPTAVAMPVELMVATVGELEVHVTKSVSS